MKRVYLFSSLYHIFLFHTSKGLRFISEPFAVSRETKRTILNKLIKKIHLTPLKTQFVVIYCKSDEKSALKKLIKSNFLKGKEQKWVKLLLL